METTLTLEQKQTLEQEISVVGRANALVIKTAEQSIAAQEVLKEIKTRQKRIEAFFKSMKDTAHKAWRTICDTESGYLSPLEEAEKTIKFKVTTYVREEERKQQEEARKAEAVRLERKRKELERIEELARKARENGKVEKAEALEEKAAAVVAPPVFMPPPAPIKAQGSAFKKIWKAEVTNVKALCQSIINGKVSPDVLDINQSAINKLAGVCKSSMTIPGLRFYEETSMSVKA